MNENIIRFFDDAKTKFNDNEITQKIDKCLQIGKEEDVLHLLGEIELGLWFKMQFPQCKIRYEVDIDGQTPDWIASDNGSIVSVLEVINISNTSGIEKEIAQTQKDATQPKLDAFNIQVSQDLSVNGLDKFDKDSGIFYIRQNGTGHIFKVNTPNISILPDILISNQDTGDCKILITPQWSDFHFVDVEGNTYTINSHRTYDFVQGKSAKWYLMAHYSLPTESCQDISDRFYDKVQEKASKYVPIIEKHKCSYIIGAFRQAHFNCDEYEIRPALESKDGLFDTTLFPNRRLISAVITSSPYRSRQQNETFEEFVKICNARQPEIDVYKNPLAIYPI